MASSKNLIRGPHPTGVAITRDAFGVLHIRAQDDAGLHWAMGYAHALDRGLQMLLTRILGQGRACECLADDDEMLGVDRFFRRMNWSGRSEEAIVDLEPETRVAVDAYCAGVNARFNRKTPWELRLLRYKAEPWTPADVILMTRIIGYVNLAQSQADLERLFIEMVQAGVDDDRLDALFPGMMAEADRALIEKITLHERHVPTALWGVVPRVMASNNWVVAPERTATGHAILANDPHLEVNRLPAVWCEQVLSAPGVSVVAATMPGIPGPIIGRNPHLAWGATYTFMDAVDSWVEECRDGAHRRGDAWVPFRVRRERVLRKKHPPEELVFYENDHGVLEGDPHTPGFYLATRWASAETGAASLNGARALWRARTVEEGMPALGGIETAWNWVLADADGHIGYQMSGRMPLRRAGWRGFAPVAGWDPENDWKGFVAIEDLPRVIDPPEGFIVTANQDLNHLGVADPINAPMGGYRADAITACLAANDKVTVSTCKALQNDVKSPQADALMTRLRPHLPETENGRLLGAWDGTYGPESVAATLFERVYEALFHEVFGGNGLGPEVMAHLFDETGLITDFYAHFDRNLFDPTSPWWKGLDADTVYAAALARGLQAPARAWGEENPVVLRHILLGGKLPLFAGFDRGPIPLKGGRATPNQGQVYRSAGRETCFAPSIRFVTDLGEPTASTALAGGASDRRFSRWYVSDVNRWLKGEYKILQLPS